MHVTVAGVPVVIVWCSTASILQLFGIDASLAQDVGVFTRIMIFGLVPAYTFECLRKYLQVCMYVCMYA